MLKRMKHFHVLALMLFLPVLQAASENRPASPTSALYVSNFNSNTITAYDATSGAFLRTAVMAGPELSGANGFTMAPDGSFYVAGQFSNNIVHYSHQGQLIGILDPRNLAGISSPQGVNFGPDGLLYVASFDNDRIVRFDVTTGQFKDTFVQVRMTGISHMGPIEPRFESDGNLIVSTFDGGRILKYQGPPGTTNSPPGTLLKVFNVALLLGGGAASYASSVTFSSIMRVYVDAVNAQTLTGEVQEFFNNGTFVSTLVPNGTAGLALTGGIAIGPDGKLYIANVRVNTNFQDIGSEVLRFNPVSGQFLGILVPPGMGLNVPFAMRFGRP